MNTSASTILVAAATTALTLGSTAALAQNNDSDASDSSTMTIVETVQMLHTKGYTDIDSIDRDWSHYEVEAVGPDGQRVELEIDGANGEILRSERDD